MDKGHVLFKDIVLGNGKGTSNSKLMLEEDDIDLLDNDFQMEFADGLPSTRFSDRVQALMQNSMVKSIMIKLLGQKIGGLNAMLNKIYAVSSRDGSSDEGERDSDEEVSSQSLQTVHWLLGFSLQSMHLSSHSLLELNLSTHLEQTYEVVLDSVNQSDAFALQTEHIATILNGLPSEFDPLMVVITASREPFSLERGMSVLIDVETRLRDPLRLPVGINTVQNNSQLMIFKAT
ncbi:hypothetical protein Golob_006613 [Gossypium lobatum]|uniref:Uncharacterized protein n=1 Tax=Gossypium lobatum TaxID=34289 RepID=A0A7J8MWQ6_9ROSI|nr:hypothetical protein [Gossypium lobatum]